MSGWPRYPMCCPSRSVAQVARRYSFLTARLLLSAIIEFSKQADVQVLASGEKLNGVKTAGVAGRLSVEQGLQTLLIGTGLSYRLSGEGTVALVASNSTSSTIPQTQGQPQN